MSRVFPARVASVRVDQEDIPHDPMPMATALLAASPRVAVAGPGLWRADARGWERRGGDVALAHALRIAASGAGASRVGIGVADVPGEPIMSWWSGPWTRNDSSPRFPFPRFLSPTCSTRRFGHWVSGEPAT